jgi:hypothetical protein
MSTIERKSCAFYADKSVQGMFKGSVLRDMYNIGRYCLCARLFWIVFVCLMNYYLNDLARFKKNQKFRANIYREKLRVKRCKLSQIVCFDCFCDPFIVDIYNSFTKGEVETKLMSALLTGVNRAFPYAALEPTQLDQQLGG